MVANNNLNQRMKKKMEIKLSSQKLFLREMFNLLLHKRKGTQIIHFTHWKLKN